jgi:hypothetical protein
VRLALSAAAGSELVACRANPALEERNSTSRITDLDDELVVELVIEIENDGSFRIVHVPENGVSVAMKGAGSEDAGNIGAEQAKPVIPSARGCGVGVNAFDVHERYLEAAAQRPHLVEPLHLEHGLLTTYRDLYHCALPEN